MSDSCPVCAQSWRHCDCPEGKSIDEIRLKIASNELELLQNKRNTIMKDLAENTKLSDKCIKQIQRIWRIRI